MSRIHPHDTKVTGAEIDDDQYPPHSAPNQASQGVSTFSVDGSGPISSMYLEMATEEDKKMVENWKADADAILIFTSLFSVVVAFLVSVSVQDIRPSPQDTSNFYLANIYQTIADPNQSNVSNPLPFSPPTFSPPNYAVWVNALWFLSLAISLTCALLAMLLQQWARRYLKVTQPHYSPHKRARIRAFFAEGVDKFFLPWFVEALPTLVHTSLFLFFVGLVVFLCNVNLTIFGLVLAWVGVGMAFYGCITFIPIFRHDCPYHTPLALLAWFGVIGTSYATFRVLRWFTGLAGLTYQTYDRFRYLQHRCRKLLVRGMLKTAEETALNSSSEIDTRSFMWTFSRLDEDHELERFFSSLSSSRNSEVVVDPLLSLPGKEKRKVFEALFGLWDRTISSGSLPEPVKSRRAVICMAVLNSADFPDILYQILNGDRYRVPQAAEFGHSVSGLGNSGNQHTTLLAQAMVSSILARAQRRDDSWFVLASSELGVSKTVLRNFASYGDSLSLAILIHITRQQFSHFRNGPWPRFGFSKVLEAASKFNVQDTSPELQHEFCALWNQIVLDAQNDSDRSMAFEILGQIRDVYVALHQDTDSAPIRSSSESRDKDVVLFEPSSYPVCNVASHIHDDSASTSFVHTVLQGKAPLVPASLAHLDAPSSSVTAPRHVEEGLTDLPPLDNLPGTTIEGFRIPATYPVPVHMVQGGIDTFTRTTPILLSTPEPSAASTPPPISMTSTSPPGAAAVQHIADRRTFSDVLDVPSSPTPVLDNMPPTESHSSMLATAPLGPSPHVTSAPDLGAAVGEGSTKAASQKGRDAPDPPSASRANIMAASDLSPHLPSSASDVAISGPSRRSPDTEHIGDHPQHLSHGQYDIV